MSIIPSDDYEIIKNKRDFQIDNITEALEIVRNFIIKNKRILTGGMAIDLSMRSINEQLYSDDTLPDYDFFSPEFHKDAYYLAVVLSKKFSGVSAIRARHVSTMRVRVNTVPVADITYMPQNIYENIPVIFFNGINIVHPNYQMIDQHRALSLPYENPPNETITGSRWKKDIDRYDLINERFPVDYELMNDFDKFETTLNLNDLSGICFGGYVSLLFWLGKAKELGFGDKTITSNSKSKLHVSELNIDDFGKLVIGSESIFIQLNITTYITILTDDIKDVCDKIKGEKTWYNSLCDKIPRKVTIKDKKIEPEIRYEIIDNKGRLIGAYQLQSKRIWFSNLQDVMCYLLTLGIFYKSPLALFAYRVAQRVLFWACKEYINTGKEEFIDFLPTEKVYGNFNLSESYLVLREQLYQKIGIIKKVDELPKNFYPENGEFNEELNNFNPEKTKLYMFDSKECDPFF